MRQIILSDQEAGQIATFLELTSGRITEELKLWGKMKGKAPNAEKNIAFWKETAQAIETLRNQLR